MDFDVPFGFPLKPAKARDHTRGGPLMIDPFQWVSVTRTRAARARLVSRGN